MIKRVIICIALTGWSILPVSAEEPSNSIASQLLVQLQMLQQEVLELRGLAEEQAHQVKQMKDTQRDHYLDLDRRMGKLQRQIADGISSGSTNHSGSAASAPLPTTPVAAVAKVVPAAVSQVPLVPNAAEDKTKQESDAYAAAYGLVKEKKFEQASSAFEQLLQRYPGGKFSPNAHYWLGELYMVDSNLDSAAASFSNVVNEYPKHWKSADALYKLGDIFFRLGDPSKSKGYLQRVLKQFPESTAARFSSRYLKTNFSE